MHIVGAASWLYILMKHSTEQAMIKDICIIRLFLGFVVIFFYSFLVVLANSTSYSYLAFPIYYIADVIPFGLSVAIYSRKRELTNKDFFTMVMFVGEVQAFCSVLAIFVPGIQRFFVDRLIDYGYMDIYQYLSGFRLYGFAANMTFSMPILQSILLLIALNLSINGSPWYILSGITLAFSAVINARVSLIVTLIGSALLLISSKLTVKKKFKLLVIIILSSYIVVTLFIPILINRFSDTFKWVFSGALEINLFLRGQTNQGYFSYITRKDNYPMPKGIGPMLFGKGHITMGMSSMYGVSSDIGYINDLWFGGIFYIAILYLFFMSIIWRLYRSKDHTASLLGLCLLFIYPITNIKGIMFSMNSVSNLVILSYIYVISAEKTKKEVCLRENGISKDIGNYTCLQC